MSFLLIQSLQDRRRQISMNEVFRTIGAYFPSQDVLDVGDILIHIFQKDLREFYQLEHLWQEAKVVKWP